MVQNTAKFQLLYHVQLMYLCPDFKSLFLVRSELNFISERYSI